YFVLILLVVVIAFIDPTFLSLTCLRDILMQSSTRIIIAMGAFFAILIAGCDLSAGRMVGFGAVIAASMLQAPTYLRLFYPHLPLLPLLVPVFIAILVGLLFGLFNGFTVAKLGLPPFIATLGSMVIIYGINSIYFDMPPNNSQPIGGLRADFTELGTGSFGPQAFSIPYILVIAVIIAFLMWVLMNKTRFGKNCYAMGGNVNAAKVSGINVARTTLVMFTIAGGLFALGGVLEAARTGGATNNYGNGYEFDAITACVVGGVSTTGGIGTIQGILAGVFILTIINYGLTFIGLNPYWQQIIKGLIIVFAVAVDIRKYLAKK
ncbi:MAG TPA: galactose/methyl galactoside ABC transporter permease MglC, partial [Firmicutes bacterium]|nr:galactose/methyl galactoside ABC transporter permease MglC [Bacillota bacterium]